MGGRWKYNGGAAGSRLCWGCKLQFLPFLLFQQVPVFPVFLPFPMDSDTPLIPPFPFFPSPPWPGTPLIKYNVHLCQGFAIPHDFPISIVFPQFPMAPLLPSISLVPHGLRCPLIPPSPIPTMEPPYRIWILPTTIPFNPSRNVAAGQTPQQESPLQISAVTPTKHFPVPQFPHPDDDSTHGCLPN